MNARQPSMLNKILSENTDRATRRALVLEYARLEAQPVAERTRVRTPHGFGTVTYPDAVPVRLDATDAEIVLVPVADLSIVENGRAAS